MSQGITTLKSNVKIFQDIEIGQPTFFIDFLVFKIFYSRLQILTQGGILKVIIVRPNTDYSSLKNSL